MELDIWGGAFLFFSPRSCFPDSSGLLAPKPETWICSWQFGNRARSSILSSHNSSSMRPCLWDGDLRKKILMDNREAWVVWAYGKMADLNSPLLPLLLQLSAENMQGDTSWASLIPRRMTQQRYFAQTSHNLITLLPKGRLFSNTIMYWSGVSRSWEGLYIFWRAGESHIWKAKSEKDLGSWAFPQACSVTWLPTAAQQPQQNNPFISGKWWQGWLSRSSDSGSLLCHGNLDKWFRPSGTRFPHL